MAAWLASVARMGGGSTMGGRFSVGSFGFFVVLWVLMMAAMMFPSAWPALSIYGLVGRRRASGAASAVVRSGAFVGGYLGSWTAFGVAAFSLLMVVRAAGTEGLSAAELTRYGVAPVALLAAAYEATPFKRVCLRHCRGPLHFFMSHWRDGVRGALVMGGRHGAYCVGCCWVLMLVLIALGVTSVGWMAAVSVGIAVEKLAPARWARVADRLLILGLVVLGLVAVARPSWIGGMAAGGGMELSM